MADGIAKKGIVGTSSVMGGLFSKLEKVAKHDVPVLIEGESGTGKELFARAIHYSSPRKDNEFVVINCSAFPDNLLEAELFGHLKGAFTGAIKEKQGLFEVADNGTFFLDEIGELPVQWPRGFHSANQLQSPPLVKDGADIHRV